MIFFYNFRFTVDGPKLIVSGLYADSPDEEAREAAYKIYLHPDEHQDHLLTEMLQSRYELATICGFPTFAHRYSERPVTQNKVGKLLGILRLANSSSVPTTSGQPNFNR